MIVLSTTILSVLTIFQCHPITFFWDTDTKTGSCLNVTTLAFANSGMSIAQDVLIVVLPIPVVVKLNLETRKKIGISIMFAFGGM